MATIVHPISLEALRILCDADTTIFNKLLRDASSSTQDSKEANEEISSWSPNAVTFNNEGHVIQLDLSGRRIKNFPHEAFTHLPFLKVLNLGGTDVPLPQLIKVLEECCATVQQLYLGGNGLGDAGIQAISEHVLSRSDCAIMKLDLRYNDFGSLGAIAISGAWNKSPNNSCKLKYLYMEGNRIGDEGAIALASALRDQATSIQELYLGDNRIGQDGATHLAQSLLSNTSLRKLFLEGNQIGPVGAAAFTSVLHQMDGTSALKNLYVDNNGIGKEESMLLARALNNASVIDDLKC